MVELKDRVAIVTGAGRGIGRGIALSLAKNGAKVVVTDVSDDIFGVVKEIGATGSEGLAVKCDVTKMGEVNDAVERTLEKFGRVDILVNNAGVYPFKPFTEMTEEDWDKVMNVNLKGIFHFTKAVLPKMIEKKYGKIISISSIAGTILGYAGLVHYSASKAAVLGFTRALAIEVAQHGINVNAICPGAVETPGTKEGLTEEVYEETKKTIPIGRWGQPEDIANVVLFLASDKSSYITGQAIVADGGTTIQ